MQNMKRKITELFRGKGYYIALILCVAAVGVSGYLFTNSLSRQNERSQKLDELLSMPAVEPETTHAPSEKPASVQKPMVPAAVSDMPQAPTEPMTEPTAEPESAPAPTALHTVFPVEGELVQSYSMDHLSYNATTKDWRTHDGVDLEAEAGTTVVAAADGVVEAVYLDDYLGQTVTVRHENGYVSHYSNLAEEVAVQQGDSVKAGDKLGTVGATALLEVGAKPHLHFAVFQNNVSVDPEKFLEMK